MPFGPGNFLIQSAAQVTFLTSRLFSGGRRQEGHLSGWSHFTPVTSEGRQLTGQTRSGVLGEGLLRVTVHLGKLQICFHPQS